MAKIFTHHGSRLENLIEKSGLKKYEIANKAGISKSTLYNYFTMDELEKKKVMPVLNVLGVSWEDFLGTSAKNNYELEELRGELKKCQAEKEMWMKKYIACIEEQKEAKSEAKKN